MNLETPIDSSKNKKWSLSAPSGAVRVHALQSLFKYFYLYFNRFKNI